MKTDPRVDFLDRIKPPVRGKGGPGKRGNLGRRMESLWGSSGEPLADRFWEADNEHSSGRDGAFECEPSEEFAMPTHFGDFTLDESRRELLRANETIHLSPKAFQLLSILTEATPRAISKSDLQERL